MDIKSIGTIIRTISDAFDIQDGGPGSGNWGHKGRPDHVGGSGKGGGKHNRQGSKEQGFSRNVTEDPFYHSQKSSQRGSLLGHHEAKTGGYTPKAKLVVQKPMLTGLSDEQNEVMKKAAAGCKTAQEWLRKIPRQMLNTYAKQFAQNAYKMAGDWGYVQTDNPADIFYRMNKRSSQRVGKRTSWYNIGDGDDVARQRFKSLQKQWNAKVSTVQVLDDYYQQNHDKYLVNQALVILGKNPKHTIDWALKKANEVVDPIESTFQIGGHFDPETNTIRMNDKSIERTFTHQESIDKRKERFQRNKQRQAQGRKQRPFETVGIGVQDVMIHEYGHAVDHTYGITEDPRFVQLFESYSNDQVANGISKYANTNIKQFFAECFNESYYEDQRQISKKAMALAEVIINDKR